MKIDEKTALLDEQYMIADEDYILDIGKTEEILGWEPKYNDSDMIIEAYGAYEAYKKHEKG